MPPLLYRSQLLVAAMFICCLAAVSPARGQRVEPVSASPDDRNRLFDELAKEVAALEQQGMLLRKLVRLATPSVVHIDAEKPPAEGRRTQKPLEEAGSGVIIRIDGKDYIATNRHVVDEAPLGSVKIKLDDGRFITPVKRWEDRETDIAILAVNAQELVPARVGNSDDVEIGDFVLAVGSPFGLSHSVTFGIIGAKGRRDLELGDGNIRYQDFLQTDAAINPGNSGGPLLNLRGEVIGINTAIASSSGGSEGIGFTIPINMVMAVASQFVQHGRLMRAYLGVELNDNFTYEAAMKLGLPRPQGALVKSVKPGTPAAKDGLQENDIVLEFDGRRVEDDEHFIKIVGFTQVGKKVEIVILRGGKTTKLNVTVGDRNEYPSP